MTSSIRNVIFDMGGVLMTFNSKRFATIFTDTEEDAELLDRALFDRNEWALLDAGVISHETMRRIAEATLPERLLPNLHECIAHWPEHSEPIAPTNSFAAQLKERGFGLYLLSNASTRIDEQLGHCPAYPLMDGRVVSAEERLMKPDPAIYQLLCERYGLDSATCIFVDDNLNNCHGAEVAGMQSFHFITDDAEASVAQLERILDL